MRNVGGQGLDGTGANYTDIIAKAVSINAGVWANNLAVTTGRNTVSADNTQVAPLVSNAGETGVSIDVSALGGMYAGQIRLVVTEAGVAAGSVENHADILAAGNLNVSGGGDVGNAGLMQIKSACFACLSRRGRYADIGVLLGTFEACRQTHFYISRNATSTPFG